MNWFIVTNYSWKLESLALHSSRISMMLLRM